MKRFLVLACAFLACCVLVGCGSDSREGLIDSTITMIKQAAAQVGTIKNRVVDATKKAQEKSTKLDLTDAIKAAEQLKNQGEEAQKIKRRIDLDRGTITEENQKEYLKKKMDRIVPAFQDLDKKTTELRQALAKAEQLSPAAKSAVEDFQKKLREAVAPFEALAR